MEKTKRVDNTPSQMDVRRGFEVYGPGKRKKVAEAEVSRDEMLEQLKIIWKEFECPVIWGTDHSNTELIDSLKKLKYTPADVERFSIAIEEFQNSEELSEEEEEFYGDPIHLAGKFKRERTKFALKAGIFLSAMINVGEGDEFTVRTGHLEVLPSNFGFENTKTVMVIGDVGEHLGYQMKGGSITIEGNAGKSAGYMMEDGEIVIEGNAGTDIGMEMSGGNILVKKNAGRSGGYKMKNGEIVVRGNAGNFLGSGMKGGRMIVLGNVEGAAAEEMGGGTIVVEGNVDHVMGYRMGGGVVHVNGERPRLSHHLLNGIIYHKGERITGND